MFRAFTSFIARAITMADPAIPKKVPIPANGVDYRGKVVLAPMVRSGELPSRLIALKYGADLVWGPETIDRSLIGCTRRYCERTKTIVFSRTPSNGSRSAEHSEPAKESVIYRLYPELERNKLIFQIGTAKPEFAVQAAKLVAGDVAGIDVNSGCPKPFSTSGGMGAALLKDPDRLCAILMSLVEEVGKPWQIGISVKIRILGTQKETVELVKRLCGTGITGLTVHCRTTPMRPRERAIRDQLRAVVQTCHEAGVACVMNGDVANREQAVQLMQEFGADGAMIATAAEKNPSVFRTQEDGGPAPWREIVKQYVETAMSVENRWGNTKFTLAQLIPGKQEKTIQVSQCRSHVDTVKALGFEDLLGMARDVDGTLGLDDGSQSKATKRVAAKPAGKEAQAVKKMKRELIRDQEETINELREVDATHGSGMATGAVSAIAA